MRSQTPSEQTGRLQQPSTTPTAQVSVVPVGGTSAVVPAAQRLSPLDELCQRLAVVRDRVRGVALKRQTGFGLYGPAGTSKTFTVRTTFEEIEAAYHYHVGHLTPLGLFELLQEHRERTIVLDDIADLFKSQVGLSILLAALGNQPDDTGERLVRYRRQGRDETIRFTGGIVFISNLELNKGPLGEALKSRVNYLRYDPTSEQIAALMLDVASKGWRRGDEVMTAEECLEVANFILAESAESTIRVDMRNLVDKGFPDYLQHRNGQTESHWKDLILSTMAEELVPLSFTPAPQNKRDATKEQLLRLIAQIRQMHPTRRAQIDAWERLTGKDVRALRYRETQYAESLSA